ncbi:hypothetical protein [Palaeococcus ferrophilus]|uniref:hypothetical protein n=1 Tax=Palaeococcus ferrophilus TaxID=83868 RepID=UPI00064F70CB|nr:hypothetical protein [Palaeococcus ferrophilus]
MRAERAAFLLIIAILLAGASFAGSYGLRWVFLLLASMGMFVLFLAEARIYYAERPRREKEEERKDEFERMTHLIELAGKGSTSRNILYERLIELYARLEDRPISEIKSDPPAALREYWKGDFYDSLDGTLSGIEEEIERRLKV